MRTGGLLGDRCVEAAASPTGSKDGTARIWDAKNGAEPAQLRGFDGPFTSVAATPDGARIIGNDNTGKAANDMVKGYFANRRKILSNIADKVSKYD